MGIRNTKAYSACVFDELKYYPAGEEYVLPLCDRYYYLWQSHAIAKDHLGSIRQTVDETGVIVAAQDYYAYGEFLRSVNNASELDKYKFTEKERDTETGLDYGVYSGSTGCARYYNSALGMWLSVDPRADKYPGWSPYNYCVGNPLVIIDPDGKQITKKEIKDKDGNVHYQITYTATIIDRSGTLSKDKLNEIKNILTKQIQSSFKGISKDGNVSWVTNADIVVGNTARKDDHSIFIDQTKDKQGNDVLGLGEIGGKAFKLDTDLAKSDNYDQIARTGAHEFGHKLGLDHYMEGGLEIRIPRGNIMQQSSGIYPNMGFKINEQQMREVQTKYNSNPSRLNLKSDPKF